MNALNDEISSPRPQNVTENRPMTFHVPLSSGRETTLITLLNAVLRRRWQIVRWCLVCGMVSVAWSLWRRAYVAASLIAPQSSSRSASQFAGLAAQFGISLARAGEGDSPELYARVLRSRELLREVALTRYRFAVSSDRRDTLEGTLVSLYGVRGRTDAERDAAIVDRLERDVRADADLKVGVIELSTTAHWPELAVKINRNLLDGLSRFNLQKRQSQAAAERKFVEDRMRTAQDSLRLAEEALARFQSENRRYQESPQLVTAAGRLQRRVDFAQQLYASLAKAYEEARIEEVRNTPVVTIIDPPEGSARRRGFGLLSSAALGVLIGAFLSIGLLLINAILGSHRSINPAEFEEFDELKRASLRELLPSRFRARAAASVGAVNGK